MSYDTLKINLNDTLQSSQTELKDQFITMRLQLCEKCENNRVVCILRPMCKDRRFLDVLIGTSDYEKLGTIIPHFCYSQRLKEFSQAKAKNAKPLNDVWISVEDLPFALGIKEAFKLRKGQKNVQHIFELLNVEQTYKKISEDIYLLMIDRILYLVDFSTNICICNLQGWEIREKNLLIMLFELIAQSYHTKITFAEEPGNFLVFQAEFSETIDKSKVESVIKKTDYIYSIQGNKIIGEITLNHAISADILSIFNAMMTITTKVESKERSKAFVDEKITIDTTKKLDEAISLNATANPASEKNEETPHEQIANTIDENTIKSVDDAKTKSKDSSKDKSGKTKDKKGKK